MFSQRAMSRMRTRKPERKIRGMLEVLETRKLMAGDLNMGSYVIGGDDFKSDTPPAMVQSLEPAIATAPAAPPTVDTADPIGVDAALTADQSWLPPAFLPCCPAVKLDNPSADAAFMESGDPEANTTDPIKPVTPLQTIGTMGGVHGSRDRAGANPRAATENRFINPLSSTGIQSGSFLAVSGGSDEASEDKIPGDELAYFTADGSQVSPNGPSLAGQSLSPYVQSDVFMAMGLLPAPLYAHQDDDSTFASQSESRSYQSGLDYSDGWIDGQDLDSLREDAAAMDAGESVTPLPFLGAGMHSLSAAMAGVVGLDFYGLDAETLASEDASLIAKLGNNRYQFAAFAFVFTIVSVRMNSNDSKREESESKLDQKSPQVPN